MTVVNDSAQRSWGKPQNPNPGPGNSGLYACLVVFLLGFTAVGGKLFVLQVRDAQNLQAMAKRQSEMRLTLHGERGTITDRSNRILVSSARCWSYGVDLESVEHKDSLAAIFARVFGNSRDGYRSRMESADAGFVWLERGVDEVQSRRLESISDAGFVRLREPQRRYEMPIAAQVIGVTNIDNAGISGLELMCDSTLAGTPGFAMLTRDGLGRRRPDVDLPHVAALQGEDLMLTIDATLQNIVEQELKEGVDRAAADAGTAVLLDPRTGEILAMASYPAVVPVRGIAVDQAALRNRAVTDVLEPGSTFKIVAASAALEEGLVAEDERFNGEHGSYTVDNVTITDSHPIGEVTFSEAVAQSSNICFAKLASRFKRERFYKYVRDFGFGIPTGVDLPGEVRGDVVRPDASTPTTQMFNSFGYGIASTPLQLACAYAAIANGGVLMRPYIVKERRSTDGKSRIITHPQMVRRVVSARTAARMTALLNGVVDHGTGTEAKLATVRVAGKTGTSQQLVHGEYSKQKYSASFVGFFPSEQPRAVLLVTLDAPRNGYYGGAVAAPVFRGAATRILTSRSYLALAASGVEHASDGGPVTVPDVKYLSFTAADQLLGWCGLSMEGYPHAGMVTGQAPVAGAVVPRGSNVNVIMVAAVASEVPDTRGLCLRQAVNAFHARGIPVRAEGTGVVAAQMQRDGAWTLVGSAQ
jgi:cell division protein FtsI (penicillin-binding protein 3)